MQYRKATLKGRYIGHNYDAVIKFKTWREDQKKYTMDWCRTMNALIPKLAQHEFSIRGFENQQE